MRCLICDFENDHPTDECPHGTGLEETDEQHLRCAFCGERYDPRRPNAGDGWAEMGDPEDLNSPSFQCHYACGLERGLELA